MNAAKLRAFDATYQWTVDATRDVSSAHAMKIVRATMFLAVCGAAMAATRTVLAITDATDDVLDEGNET